MTALSPFCRLIDCTTNTVLATTSNLLDYSFGKDLDKVSTRSLVVPAGDAGDANGTTIPSGYAAALLLAASDVLTSTPKPLLCEFSLDGGTTVDSRWLVRTPQRTLAIGRRTLTDSGNDLAEVLGCAIIERATYTDVQLSDALAGNPSHTNAGTIIPLAPLGLLNASEPIPYLSGILNVAWTSEPGLEGWASGAAGRLAITAVINPQVAGTATNVDVNAATVLSALQTIVNRLAGAAASQDYGHLVLDTSSSTLNLSSSTNFSPAPTAVGMSAVVGHKGTSAHCTFDATGAIDVDETTTALVNLGASSVQVTDAGLSPAANFIGGKSRAGMPQDAAVTALGLLNGAPPAISSGRDQWQDCLPLVGLDVKGQTGGVYFTILDGQLTPLPGSPSAPVHSITVDVGDGTAPRDAAIYAGTPHGVYWAHAAAPSLTVFPSALTWARLGTLDGDVIRLQTQVNPSDTTHAVVFALVANSGERWDGLWQYTAAAGWVRHIQSTKVRDFVSTDYQTVWIIDEKGDAVYKYAIGTDSPNPAAGYALPAGAAYALGRAITVATPAQDSVWAFVDGAVSAGHYSPAYYLYRTDPGTTWAWADANVDNTLVGDSGAPLHVYTVAGTGVTIDSTYSGPTPSAFIGTDQGVLWTGAPLGGSLAWRKADMGGLGNYAVRGIVMGQGQNVLGKGINRLYATTDNDLLYSCDSGRYWDQLAGREKTTMGPHLSRITLGITDANGSGTGKTLPSNNIRTWGTKNADGTNMTASPLGLAANTHVYVASANADAIPAGYYVERYMSSRLDFEYRLRRQGAHLPGQQMSQLPELQTGAAVQANDASAGVITVAKRWMQQEAVARTQITLQCSFSTQQSALRTLRPTHLCHLVGTVQVKDLSSAGTAVTTNVLTFAGTEALYCISHQIKKGPGETALTTTVLSPQLLAQPLSENDLALALADQIHSVRIWGTR